MPVLLEKIDYDAYTEVKIFSQDLKDTLIIREVSKSINEALENYRERVKPNIAFNSCPFTCDFMPQERKAGEKERQPYTSFYINKNELHDISLKCIEDACKKITSK